MTNSTFATLVFAGAGFVASFAVGLLGTGFAAALSAASGVAGTFGADGAFSGAIGNVAASMAGVWAVGVAEGVGAAAGDFATSTFSPCAPGWRAATAAGAAD